jgi:hypothetical protein
MTLTEWFTKNFPDQAAYERNNSAKIDRLLKIVQHHSGDANSDAPPLCWSPEGDVIAFEGATEPKSDYTKKRRKIVVYCHLSQSWTLVAHVSTPSLAVILI